MMKSEYYVVLVTTHCICVALQDEVLVSGIVVVSNFSRVFFNIQLKTYSVPALLSDYDLLYE